VGTAGDDEPGLLVAAAGSAGGDPLLATHPPVTDPEALRELIEGRGRRG
jgi:hypothetical protein